MRNANCFHILCHFSGSSLCLQMEYHSSLIIVSSFNHFLQELYHKATKNKYKSMPCIHSISLEQLEKMEKGLRLVLKPHLIKFSNKSECALSLFVLKYLIFMLRDLMMSKICVFLKIHSSTKIYRDKQVNIRTYTS